jgi:sugar lactone lactonase YvrE
MEQGMKKADGKLLSRRSLLWSAPLAAVGAAVTLVPRAASAAAVAAGKPGLTGEACAQPELLGQGAFQYHADRYWGRLDRKRYPVADCHGICADRAGRIVMLTNDTHNNLIAYSRAGQFRAAWETRFPAAHGFDIVAHGQEERYWITDHDRQVVSVCTPDGRELRVTGPDALAHKYPDLQRYHPTNSATLPDGQFYVSDGYGSSFVHHFDPDGRHVASFGGEGDAPEQLRTPHAVWIDTRSGKPLLLVCDRSHDMLKWFSLSGELQRVVPVPGSQPSNVAAFSGRYHDHLAIAGLNGMILILDGSDRVVSCVGGDPPKYVDGKLQPLSAYNYTFIHPHDVYVDSAHALYVVQWASNQTYPIKLELATRQA